MSKIKCSGQFIGQFDNQVQCDFGILGVLGARVLADLYFHRDYGYMANVHAVVVKLQQFNIDIMYKVGKSTMLDIESTIIQEFKRARDIEEDEYGI